MRTRLRGSTGCALALLLAACSVDPAELPDAGAIDGGARDGAVGDAGGASVDPCADVVCDAPPTPSCVAPRTLRTWGAAGTCSAGECSYPFVDSTCEDGCTADACGPSGSWRRMADTGAPSPRAWHVSVWTGTELIVWSGRGSSSSYPLETGGRYDPETDTWTPTSMVGVPLGRTEAEAVWTGTEMIVWGGAPGWDTGARYDPATDTWAPTSTDGAPSGRYGHTSVWTGTEMIVWGGRGGDPLNDGGRYDPATDTWAPMSTVDAPSARWEHEAVWTGTEMIVWGGSGDGSPAEGGRYDPATDTWAPITPQAYDGHHGVWTGTEMIAWGGDGSVAPLVLAYDPITDAWRTLALPESGLPPRRGHSIVWTGSEVIVWGVDPTSEAVGGGGDRLDLARERFVAVPTTDAPPRRTLHTALWTGEEMIVWGGSVAFGSGSGTFFGDGARFAPGVLP